MTKHPEKKKHTAIDMATAIIVKGARTHNLKNVTVAMPRNAMVVFTGLSGSGKSSLAFDKGFLQNITHFLSPPASQTHEIAQKWLFIALHKQAKNFRVFFGPFE